MLGKNAIAASRLALRLDRGRPRYIGRGIRPHIGVFTIQDIMPAALIATIAVQSGYMILLNVSFVLLSESMAILVATLTPPVVLYLGPSGDHTMQMQVSVSLASTSYRVAALLRSPEFVTRSIRPLERVWRALPLISVWQAFWPRQNVKLVAIMANDFRQGELGIPWTKAVHDLMQLVKIIIFDGRTSTVGDPLHEERMLIRTMALDYKIFWIIDPGSLTSEGDADHSRQTRVTEEQLLRILPGFLHLSKSREIRLNPLLCSDSHDRGLQSIINFLADDNDRIRNDRRGGGDN
jgi:hypothetical protein